MKDKISLIPSQKLKSHNEFNHKPRVVGDLKKHCIVEVVAPLCTETNGVFLLSYFAKDVCVCVLWCVLCSV